MSRSGWLILAVLLLGRIAISYQFQSIAALSPFLLASLAIDYTQLGTLIGLYMLPGIVIALPGGLLGKRFGDKRIVLLGLALIALGGAVVGASEAYPAAAAGRLLSGIGAVLLTVLIPKMTTDWFAGPRLVTAMALILPGWPLGIGLALVTQAALAEAYSWRLALYVTVALSGLALILIAAVYRRPPSGTAVAAAVGPGGRSLFGLSARELGLVSLAGLLWALYNVGYIVVLSFAPSLLVARGLSAAEAGLATSLATWTSIASGPLGGLLIERTGRATTIMLVSLIGMGATILLLPFVPWSAPMLALISLIGSPSAGAIMALPAEVLRVENRGPGLGVYYTWFYAGMALLPPVAGLARDVSGDPGAPLVFAGTLLFATVGVLGLFRMLQGRPRPTG